MAATRKLQAEIDKVLKKVEEGIEEFCNIWDSVHNATHANQREKFEAELKTQIKKLQRDREQIKTWQSDKTIKDKNALAEARKKIEGEMERFKEFERDAKTKTYSKEGLSKSDKVDPYEEERIKHRTWIQENIDKLNVKIDELDADLEAAAGAASKKKSAKKDDEEKLVFSKHLQDTHRWHVTKLEQLLRKLDNDDVNFEELDDLRDSVEYYVDENSLTPGEFQEFDTIYEQFKLDDIEDYLTKGTKEEEEVKEEEGSNEGGEVTTPKAGDKEKKEKEVKEKAPSKHTGGAAVKAVLPPASPSPTARPSGKEDSGKESGAQAQKSWPPAMSVWQNPALPPLQLGAPPPAAERKEAPTSTPPMPPKPLGTPAHMASTPPASAPRPAPTLPPPMQPAPDRPPPPGQAPVLNAPPNQPPPKPAPHQPPQMQPPTQAPPQPPLPSPPLGSPPRPQGPPAAGALSSTLAGIVSAMPMPAPPPMPPPSPQDAPPGSEPPPPPTAGGAGAPPTSEPPASAPPPPPPPLLPPPPPSPAPAPGGPPSTTPSLPPGHAKKPPAPATAAVDREPPKWPPPAPYMGDDRLQQAPKVPPPSEAPPPPSELPPPPPPEGLGSGPAATTTASAPAAVSSPSDATLSAEVNDGKSRAPAPHAVAPGAASSSSSSAAAPSAASFEPGGLMPPPPPVPAVAASRDSAGALPITSEAAGPLSPRRLHALQLLSASHRNLPASSDGRRNRKYVPRSPYVHLDTRGNAAYAMQPTRNYEDPAMFEKYDLDTLFFIFYYQQGSYQQHLAAKELKKLSWRYHTKYLTWFQRHEEPRMTASDFERGAYVYFDHESGWCQRIKSDFTFEYQFLEDEPM